ncbi:hypothetical protein MSAN_00120600 [Mycena sanguinolenta]|uniref:Protein kinase domain-containing protein n=1 Tax=Mycena sanguinolenta TaxID=230812 RepID=A0A8H6ZDG9_9AGAR|nr:hypothetical protein MSAN_00120600 [Mycena sanguinolenta]
MDDHSQPEPEFTHSSICDPESAPLIGVASRHASGMFSHSRNFTVRGRNLINITNNYAAPNLPSDFRMIPMGDIDLQHEIRVDNSTGVLNYHRQRAHVRRLYSAKVEGRKSTLTVAMYQGHGAEEKWRQDIAKYMSMRHPSIVQICGAASSNGIHATLFNDDLIPLEEVLDRYRDSPVWTAYIYAFCNRDFSEVNNYLNSEFQLQRYSEDCTNWIRRSTGRLCTELTQSNGQEWLNSLKLVPHHLPRIWINAARTEPIDMVGWLTLEQYHHICDWNLRKSQCFDFSASTTVHLGGVSHCPIGALENSIEMAFLPSTTRFGLYDWTTSEGSTGEAIPNGWTRFRSGDVFNNTLSISVWISWTTDPDTWLSQANHTFRRLNIVSNFEDYVVVERIYFDLKFSQTTGDPPEGFLFLSCTAYWSLDPSGIDRLGFEEVTQFEFPSFELTTNAYGLYWDSSVYDGLRQFHEAKGFDPYSQDVARHLGLPFFRLSSERDALPWAYVDSDGEDFDADIDSDCTDIDSDPDIDAEAMHHEKDVHDPTCEDFGSVHTDISDCERHDASESTSGAAQAHEISTVQNDIPEPRLLWSFKCLMATQLALILFLALSSHTAPIDTLIATVQHFLVVFGLIPLMLALPSPPWCRCQSLSMRCQSRCQRTMRALVRALIVLGLTPLPLAPRAISVIPVSVAFAVVPEPVSEDCVRQYEFG